MGNGAGVDNILVANRGTGSELSFQIRNGSTNRELRQGSFHQTSDWYHLVVSQDTDGKMRL